MVKSLVLPKVDPTLVFTDLTVQFIHCPFTKLLLLQLVINCVVKYVFCHESVSAVCVVANTLFT